MTFNKIDEIIITDVVQRAWEACIRDAIEKMKITHSDLSAHEVGDEDFRTLPDGRGMIFLQIREVLVEMEIPADQWDYISQN